ncbi:outer membrane usher protein FimD/PapC [Pedobacter sp. CG_S7]|uniref:ISAon1 family transposase N-terminal region protein n=1 Tax=Pedobacter sp. CG_S7 TaxID=3143930 RepID=UPI003391AEDF
MDFSLSGQFLPTDLLLHFEIVSFKELGDLSTRKDCFYIYLDEKNSLPFNLSSSDYESKGFFERTMIQDFPIRGKAVYLCIKRRRWRNKSDKSIEIKSDYSFIAEGSKLTIELSDFLKGTGRDPRRYDK